MRTRRLITPGLIVLSLGCSAAPVGVPSAKIRLLPAGEADARAASALDAITARLLYSTYSLYAYHIDADGDGDQDDTIFSIGIEVSDQPGCQKLSEAYILWSLDEVVLDTPGPIPSWVPVPGETIQGAGGYPCAGGAFCLNGYPRARVS